MSVRTIIKKRTEAEDRLHAAVLIIQLIVQENSDLKARLKEIEKNVEFCSYCFNADNEFTCDICNKTVCESCVDNRCENDNHERTECKHCSKKEIIKNSCSSCSEVITECEVCFKEGDLHCVSCKKSYCYSCLEKKICCDSLHDKCNDCLNNGADMGKRNCGCVACKYCLETGTKCWRHG